MKNIYGFSLIELLVTLAIAGILIGSTGGVITRLLLNGNQIKANIAEVDLTTDICRTLNHFDTCKNHFRLSTITQLRLRSGEILRDGYVYKKFLEIVKINVKNSSDPDVTKTLNVYYKKLNVSFGTVDSCTSTNLAECEKQSYDVKFDFTDPNNEICYTIYCGNTSASNLRDECNSNNEGIIKYESSQFYVCHNKVWETIGITLRGQSCSGGGSKGSSSGGTCYLDAAPDGGYSGRCGNISQGRCRYYCHKGEWLMQVNVCGSSVLRNYHDKYRLETVDLFADNPVPTPSRQPCPSTIINNCELPETVSSVYQEGYCVNGATGTCIYQCNYGNWINPQRVCTL